MTRAAANPDSAPPDALDAAEAALAAGEPRLALTRLARLHARAPTDTTPFDAAARTLVAAGAQGAPAEATDLIRAMIVHEPGPGHPRTLHARLARTLNRSTADTLRPVTAALMPAITALLRAPEPPTEPPTGVVLLLLVLRSLLPRGGPSQAEISRLHLARFTRFTSADLALPYSVWSRAAYFGANRDDLLRRYPTPWAALAPEAGLSLRQLLLLDQIGLGPLFPAGAEDTLADTVVPRLAQVAGNPDEVRAARALVMRYLRAADGAAADRLRATGLAPALLETAARWSRHDRQAVVVPRARAPRLDGLVRRAVASGRNALVLATPALARPGRKPRIALCVSGQLRGYERAFETWKRALLPFGEFDIYVHTWARVGRAIPQSGRKALPFEGTAFREAWWRLSQQEGRLALQARQPHLMAALEVGNTVDAARVRAVYGAVEAVVEDERDPRFNGFTNQDKMHYKIHAAANLAERSGRTYDLVMRLRPDMEVKLPGFSWSALRRHCAMQPVIFADLGFGLNDEWLLIGDMMAIGAPETMRVYASTWTRTTDIGALDLFCVPGHFVGHVSLAQCCWYAGVDVRILPYSRGQLLDLPPLSRDAMLQALARDAEGRDDPIDRALATAAREG